MGDSDRMRWSCGDDEPCTLDGGKTADPIELRIGLRRIDTTPTNPLSLGRISTRLVDSATGAEVARSEMVLMPNGGVVVTFRGVMQRRHVFNATEGSPGVVEYEVVDEVILVDASQVKKGIQALDLELVPRGRVYVEVTVEVLARKMNVADPDTSTVTRTRDDRARVELSPNEHTRLVSTSAGVHVFEAVRNQLYTVHVTPLNRLVLRGSTSCGTAHSRNKVTVELKQRDVVCYLTIDAEADLPGHTNNVKNMRQTLATLTGHPCVVEQDWYGNLKTIGDKIEDGTSQILAIFFSGSYDEWAGSRSQSKDSENRRTMAKDFVHTTTMPIIAVCGSHQLMAYLWSEISAANSGWNSIRHIDGMTIAQELTVREQKRARNEVVDEETPPPESLPPTLRKQVGDFRHVITAAGKTDPLFTLPGGEPLGDSVFYDTHRDEVVREPPGFVRLVEGPASPMVAGKKEFDVPSVVQGMRLDLPGRLLYSFQFHPEFNLSGQRGYPHDGDGVVFAGKTNEGGKLLRNFVRLATSFWRQKAW